MTQNNILGNAPSSNRGFLNNTGGAITAANNFWGAAGGPGADPADNVCGSAATTSPVASKPFSIKSKPLFRPPEG